MNLLALMPKLKPEIIQILAQNKQIPRGSVPLLKLEDALTLLGYEPALRERWIKERCDCDICRIGGQVLLKAWRDQRDKTDNNPGSV